MNHRYAEKKDCFLLLDLLKKHSVSQGMSDDFTITEHELIKELFEDSSAHVLFSLSGDDITGFAFFYYTFSTFTGKRVLFLEDLFVLPEYRGGGYGKYLMNTLADIARSRGCAKMEWNCLRSNTSAKSFYLTLGAHELYDRSIYRLSLD